MRVLQVIPSSGPGGAESIVASLASSLSSRDVEVTIASPGSNSYLFKKLESLGVEAIHLKSKDKQSLVHEIRRLLNTIQPTILHSHMFDANLPAVIAAKLCRLPVILTVHSTVHELESWKRRLIYRLIGRLSDKVVSVSSSVTSVLIKAGVPQRKITCIRNGVDVRRFSTERNTTFRQEIGIPEGIPAIGMIANVRPAKDHALLLRAAATIVEKIPKACFVFVGDGDVSGLARLTSELGLDRNIRFSGFKEDIASVLSSLDIFVLASKIEGLPVSIIEAMAAGLPVIASDVGGVREVVSDGQTGFLVPPSDADALAGRIMELLSNAQFAAELGSKGRERAIRGFSLEAMVEAYLKLYSECISR